MDEKPKRRRTNWNWLFFYGPLAVWLALFYARAISKDGKIPVPWEVETRNEMRRFHIYREHRIVRWFPSLFRLEPEVHHASKPLSR